MKNLAVLGSINIDLVISTNQLPKVGETIHGEETDYMLGGKGANQAVAAARMGIPTSLIGCIGTDTFGEKILKHLEQEENLDISSVVQEASSFTGLATVFKLEKDNAIVVTPGANDLCDKNLIQNHLHKIESVNILLTQLEIPVQTIKYACEIANEKGVKTILNPAPYKELPKELFTYLDYITPNELEFEGLYGKVFENSIELEEAMLEWSKMFNTSLIVTRGAVGVSFVENNQVVTIPSLKVDVVDTTGAGDTFNGVLAYALANNFNLRKSVELACLGASLSVRAFGAQTGMPTYQELQTYLEKEK